MADEESRRDGPSLELPKLGFRRKRREKSRKAEPVADTAPVTADPEPTPAADTTPVTADPEPTPAADTPSEPAAPEPKTGFRRKRRRKFRKAEPVADTAPVTADPEPTPATDTAPAPAVPEPRKAEETVAYRVPAGAEPAQAVTFVDQPDGAPDATEGEVEEPQPAPRKRRTRRKLTGFGAWVATVLTGAVVGAITVGLTWASLRLCEVTRGTSSCGGPGFLLLLAIMVAMVFLGALLLRVAGVAEPSSTSFLAIGLLAVLVLMFLVDVLFAWWMIIVIPVFSVLTFALAHWVTTAFIEPADR